MQSNWRSPLSFSWLHRDFLALSRITYRKSPRRPFHSLRTFIRLRQYDTRPLQVLSWAIQLPFAQRKLSAREHRCSEALKTRRQILFARVTPFSHQRDDVRRRVRKFSETSKRACDRWLGLTGTKFRDERRCGRKEKWRLRSLSVLPDRNNLAARAAPEARSSSSGWPRRARRHLAYPTASNWPEFPATARGKRIKNVAAARGKSIRDVVVELQRERQPTRLQLHFTRESYIWRDCWIFPQIKVVIKRRISSN